MIEVRDLYFKYHGNQENTIKGLNFSVKKGEIFGFLGPSGAGKSTTTKVTIGILKDYQGKVNILDQEIRDISPDFYEKIGVAFEFPNFFSKFTALENLRFFRSLYNSETEEPEKLLDKVGLKESANMKVSQFSKGMMMRLSFCRAILNKPEVIFLDEPTAGLDPVNARNIMNLIQEKRDEGKTIFLTTHNMQVAEELCDQVAFIVDGRFELIDSPRNLKLKWGKKYLSMEYKVKEGIETIEFPLKNLGSNIDFLKIIKEREIATIHSQEATLEDVFIEVTGRTLV